MYAPKTTKIGGFQLGSKKPEGAGRAVGTPNKTTVALKDAIMHAFDTVGGDQYLVMVALTDPKTFCTLLGKVLPKDVKVTADEGPVTIQVVQRRIIDVKPEDD